MCCFDFSFIHFYIVEEKCLSLSIAGSFFLHFVLHNYNYTYMSYVHAFAFDYIHSKLREKMLD